MKERICALLTMKTKNRNVKIFLAAHMCITCILHILTLVNSDTSNEDTVLLLYIRNWKTIWPNISFYLLISPIRNQHDLFCCSEYYKYFLLLSSSHWQCSVCFSAAASPSAVFSYLMTSSESHKRFLLLSCKLKWDFVTSLKIRRYIFLLKFMTAYLRWGTLARFSIKIV